MVKVKIVPSFFLNVYPGRVDIIIFQVYSGPVQDSTSPSGTPQVNRQLRGGLSELSWILPNWGIFCENYAILQPMSGNGNHTNDVWIYGDDWGMVQMALFYASEIAIWTQLGIISELQMLSLENIKKTLSCVGHEDTCPKHISMSTPD